MVLYAYENGKFVRSLDIASSNLKRGLRGYIYRCIGCSKGLAYVHTDVHIKYPHFKHKDSESECSYSRYYKLREQYDFASSFYEYWRKIFIGYESNGWADYCIGEVKCIVSTNLKFLRNFSVQIRTLNINMAIVDYHAVTPSQTIYRDKNKYYLRISRTANVSAISSLKYGAYVDIHKNTIIKILNMDILNNKYDNYVECSLLSYKQFYTQAFGIELKFVSRDSDILIKDIAHDSPIQNNGSENFQSKHKLFGTGKKSKKSKTDFTKFNTELVYYGIKVSVLHYYKSETTDIIAELDTIYNDGKISVYLEEFLEKGTYNFFNKISAIFDHTLLNTHEPYRMLEVWRNLGKLYKLDPLNSPQRIHKYSDWEHIKYILKDQKSSLFNPISNMLNDDKLLKIVLKLIVVELSEKYDSLELYLEELLCVVKKNLPECTNYYKILQYLKRVLPSSPILCENIVNLYAMSNKDTTSYIDPGNFNIVPALKIFFVQYNCECKFKQTDSNKLINSYFTLFEEYGKMYNLDDIDLIFSPKQIITILGNKIIPFTSENSKYLFIYFLKSISFLLSIGMQHDILTKSMTNFCAVVPKLSKYNLSNSIYYFYKMIDISILDQFRTKQGDDLYRTTAFVKTAYYKLSVSTKQFYLFSSDYEKYLKNLFNSEIPTDYNRSEYFNTFNVKIQNTQSTNLIADEVLTTQKHLSEEKYIATALTTLSSKQHSYKAYYDTKPNRAQLEAIRKGTGSGLLILSGIAGSGKTTVISTLSSVYASQYTNESVILLSFTGSAVNTMRNRVDENIKIKTVDSFLTNMMYNPNKGYKVVIVDEVSMLSFSKLYSLLHTLSALTENFKTLQHLVLVGDPNQLEPIEIGNVFEEIIKWGELHKRSYTKLTMNRRTSNMEISTYSQSVLNFTHIESKLSTGFILADKTTNGVFKESMDRLDDLVNRFANFKDKDNVMFLAPTNDDVNKINTLIQKLRGSKPGTFIVSDRIVCTKNEVLTCVDGVNKKFYNGQMFKVVEVLTDSYIIAEFGNSHKSCLPRSVINKHFKIAWCITVHYSQGKEYDNVVVYSSNTKMCSNRLIYTAITRAKKKVGFYIVDTFVDKSIKTQSIPFIGRLHLF